MEFKGLEALTEKLKDGANLDDIKKVVKLNGSEMHRKTQRYAPVDTGHLKREVKNYIEDDGFTAKTTSEAEYSVYQEYGTRYQSGTPHIRPAFHEQKEQFKRDLNRLMK